MIYITLFDQIKRTERITANHEHTYYENVYLGEVAIPITSILTGSKLEGILQVKRPLVLQNYHVVNDELLIHMDQSDIAEQQKRNDEEKPTYITVNIFLEPLINLPRENEQEYYRGFEQAPFLHTGTAWCR